MADRNRATQCLRRICSRRVAWVVLLLALASCLQTADAETTEPAASPAMAAVALPDDDITRVSLLTRADFRGDRAVVLGVRLGQTWEEAQEVIQANPELAIQETVSSGRGFYVLDRSAPAAEDRSILYCLWSGNDPGMRKLVIYRRIARFLPAGSGRLFAASSAADLPADVKSWLGPEDRAVVTVHGRVTKVTAHVFEKRALEVADFKAIYARQSVSVTFARPDLLTPERPPSDVDPRWVVTMIFVIFPLLVLPICGAVVLELRIWRSARAKGANARKSLQPQK